MPDKRARNAWLALVVAGGTVVLGGLLWAIAESLTEAPKNQKVRKRIQKKRALTPEEQRKLRLSKQREKIRVVEEKTDRIKRSLDNLKERRKKVIVNSSAHLWIAKALPTYIPSVPITEVIREARKVWNESCGLADDLERILFNECDSIDSSIARDPNESKKIRKTRKKLVLRIKQVMSQAEALSKRPSPMKISKLIENLGDSKDRKDVENSKDDKELLSELRSMLSLRLN
ncbi:hypothetical protein AAMO2058_001223800 [Amorphochlora amoebiformis]